MIHNITLMHLDGLILLLASVCFAILGQGYHRWRRRVPLFAFAALYFSIAIELLGLYRPVFLPHLLWLRNFSDGSMLVVLVMYFMAERRNFSITDHARPPSRRGQARSPVG